MRKHDRPEVVATDRLRSYGAALKEIRLSGRQETGRWLNNKAENSRLPFRRREREMLRFPRMRSLQMFTAVHVSLHNHFNSERISIHGRNPSLTAPPLSPTGVNFVPCKIELFA